MALRVLLLSLLLCVPAASRADLGTPTYSVTNIVAGQVATFTVTGMSPGSTVIFFYSTTGGGPTPTQYGDLMCTPPLTITPAFPASAQGDFSFSAFLPQSLSGFLWTHALELTSGGTGNFSNPLTLFIT